MRRISIKNSEGSILDITTKVEFFHDISGFGFEQDNTYRQVGDRWVISKKKLKQTPISGKLLLAGDSPMEIYQEFVQFCTAEPLTLIYSPYEGYEAYKECTLTKCDKSDLEKYGALNCPLEFTPTTPWYRRVIKNVEPVTSSGGWVWGTSSTWPIKWSAEQSMSISIESDSNKNSPCKLRIYGPIKNPSWEVYSAGIANGTGKITCTVPDGCYLCIDNTGDSPAIGLYSADNEFLSNLYESSDFDTTRFITLKKGINMINVSGDTTDAVRLYAEGVIYYESV